MPVNGFDGHEQRKAYRNHHMPTCVTISGRHARKSDRRKFNPCNRHQDRNTHFRRLIMTHNNILAQATSRANTQPKGACASFLDTASFTSNTQRRCAVSAILAQAISYANIQRHRACASFFGMAVSTTDALHMVAMPTILAAASSVSNTQNGSVAAPILGLYRRPSEYPPRRRVSHHKSCGNTSNVSNTQKRDVSPALILEVSH